MPYVPSKKTDGKSADREIIDRAVEVVALQSASEIKDNLSLIQVYESVFKEVADSLFDLCYNMPPRQSHSSATALGLVIYTVGDKYGYEGALLGELNYAITRFIQRIPQIKVQMGDWKDELRYWLYAATVEALTYVANNTRDFKIGISGVFEDIKDEYKRRVNPAYEAAQIIKSGDCYDTPYYTRLVEVVDEKGRHVGYQEVMLKRSEETLHLDVLHGKFVLRKK